MNRAPTLPVIDKRERVELTRPEAGSRDNDDLNKRLLPAEITGILPMIKDAEATIAEKRK